MNAIIIEDEQHQQNLLKDMLATHFPQINLLGIADDVSSGLSLVKSTHPGLVFMDVMLGSETSFDLLARLESRDFDIIFTTSYQEYAIKAFRLAAIDYLLKPIDLDELKVAVDKSFEKRGNQQAFDHVKVLLNNLRNVAQENPRIALPTFTGFILVAIDDIVRCESDNTYTTFYLKAAEPILVSKTLKACEQMLKGFDFYRVHNSSLVNLKYIKAYVKGEGGTVIMQDGSEISVSRRRKEVFLQHFQNIRL